MTNSLVQPYRVQYTDGAVGHLDLLKAPVRKKIQERMLVIASVDPYAHGVPDMSMGNRDRRVVRVERMVVTMWVSPAVKILTVVSIGEGGGDKEPSVSPVSPVSPAAWLPSSGEFGPEDDDEDVLSESSDVPEVVQQ